jgi:hypothetical protein
MADPAKLPSLGTPAAHACARLVHPLDKNAGLAAGLAQLKAVLAPFVLEFAVSGLPGLEQFCRELLTFASRLTNGQGAGDSP